MQYVNRNIDNNNNQCPSTTVWHSTVLHYTQHLYLFSCKFFESKEMSEKKYERSVDFGAIMFFVCLFSNGIPIPCILFSHKNRIPRDRSVGSWRIELRISAPIRRSQFILYTRRNATSHIYYPSIRICINFILIPLLKSQAARICSGVSAFISTCSSVSRLKW